eukprot:jgi/Botrbrau1/7122/Bobra.0143s0002.2
MQSVAPCASLGSQNRCRQYSNNSTQCGGLRCIPRRTHQTRAALGGESDLWTPRRSDLVSQSRYEVVSRNDPSRWIVCGQGPPPPNPMVVERFQQVISQLFQQRIVRLGGPVDDDMANLIVAQLLYLDSAGKNDITMYVNSPGGSVTAGMAVFDTMRHIRPDVSTVCVGLAASMGAFLLASGHKGKRYSLPNSRIMIHQPLGGAQGQAAGGPFLMLLLSMTKTCRASRDDV